MVDYFLQTTFALDTDPDTQAFQECVNNPKWWVDRYKILKNHFIPSINNQEFQNFTRLVNFENVSKDHSFKKKCIDLLDENGFHISFVEDNHPTNWPTPYNELRDRADSDWVVNYEADSDDILFSKTLSHLKENERKIKRERAFAFERGYISDKKGEKIGIFEHDSSSFYAKVYPTEVLESREKFKEYSENAKFSGGHQEITQNGKLVHLPDFNFLVLVHRFQRTTGWNDIDTKRHIEGFIEDEEKKSQIRDKFNLN